ncbi:hypothetical protein ACSZND_12705 [Aeromonas hydrophila]|uniref:hypothetical protein n=1 Tax=Aeromonas TaxID=642 RepID=UPI000493A91E|nr:MULTISPECIES: hypothetical protein [Aeromonas]MBW3799383.1 hypothetical protein [Aeromonas hydrophila]MBW3804110.1 hypothetical protein [Aeromonas hydrophila]MBW3821896.1 hypothetical protein [Aeromonas hydrophila]MCP3288107.1 hypothetical protein [Aeromonas hydrophila]MCX4106047.1 hypothetical protein [Aeromonas hydrophila]
MKTHIFLLVLLLLSLIPVAPHAQTLVKTVTWQASASKYSQASISLLHPGQQVISTVNPAEQVLAAKLTALDTGLMLKARVVNIANGTHEVILNGKALTSTYQDLPITEYYYLGYQQHTLQAKSTVESGYELITYWRS